MDFRVLSSSYRYGNRVHTYHENNEQETTRTHGFVFEITPDRNFQIEFDKDVIFKNYFRKHLSVEDKNYIYVARLNVVQRENDDIKHKNYWINGEKINYNDRIIVYRPEKRSIERDNNHLYDIELFYSLQKSDFDEIRKFISQGINPTSIRIFVESLPNSNTISYGFAPDGSMLKWDTSSGDEVEIRSLDFEFRDIIDGPDLEDLDKKYTRTIRQQVSQLEKTVEIIHSQLQGVVKFGSTFLTILLLFYLIEKLFKF